MLIMHKDKTNLGFMIFFDERFERFEDSRIIINFVPCYYIINETDRIR